jgi:hypothetical protein
MPRWPALITPLFALTTSLSGCSIYKASTARCPVATDNLQLGMLRAQVISILGFPKSTEVVNGQRVEMLKYINGHAESTKARMLVYTASDLFTIGLAELILT